MPSPDEDNTDEFTYLKFLYECIDVISVEKFAEATNTDVVLKVILQYIRRGWPNKVPKEYQTFNRKENKLTVEEGCIMWGHRLVVPQK